MYKGKKKREKYSIFRLGLLLLLFSVFLLFLLQILKLYENQNDNLQDKSSSEFSQNVSNANDESTIWSKYENQKYLIKFDYPYLLHKVEYEDPGDYDYFIVFEENQFSKEKGIAYSVSSDGLEKEIVRIKKSVSKEGKSKLIKDEKIEFRNFPSWLLEYEPENKLLEARSFFVFERGDYTYSFSTVPQQMQRLIGSIEFTN